MSLSDIEKMEKLIGMLHDVADCVEAVITQEELESLSSAIELACDIRDRLKEQTEQVLDQSIAPLLSEELKTVLQEECHKILFVNGLDHISGAWCEYEIIEEFDNGWEIFFSFGVVDSASSTTHEYRTYLRKDTLEFTENEEEVEFIPED